jgi:hypothetical protein
MKFEDEKIKICILHPEFCILKFARLPTPVMPLGIGGQAFCAFYLVSCILHPVS